MGELQFKINFPEKERSDMKLSEDLPIDNFFPEEEANILAKIESYNKHLFRPNTYLHKWWARRSGTTFRHILKQLVSDQNKRDYYEPGGLEGVIILDPMMGGGTTLHEGIRLGANVIGYDIDPIPVLQAKASLSDIPIYEKEQIFWDFFNKLREKILKYFMTRCPKCNKVCESQFFLYGIRKLYDSKELIIVDSWILRSEADGNDQLLQTMYPEKIIKQGDYSWRLIDKKEARECNINGNSSDLKSLPLYDRYIPLVTVGKCDLHGRFFKSVDSEDMRKINDAKSVSERLEFKFNKNFEINSGPKSNDLLKRNINYFYHLFTPRQLIFIKSVKDLLVNLPQEHILWISLLISTSLEFNSILCGFKGAERRRPGAIRHVFSHHAYSFPYTALENNPVFSSNTSGTLLRLFNSRILSAYKWAKAPVERIYMKGQWKKTIIHDELDFGTECMSINDFAQKKKSYIVKQLDSIKIPLPNASIDFVVTDPPYYDNVQYSDLSQFFRCWLSWFLPDYANWEYQTISSAVAESRLENEKFGKVLAKIWQECNRVLSKPHGRLIFTYHHWSPDAWTQLSNSLSSAKFRLINSSIVHSENPISVHIKNLRALKHDSILVFQLYDHSFKKRWEKPDQISLNSSYEFCKACAGLLGWVLENSLSPEETHKTWSEFLRTT